MAIKAIALESGTEEIEKEIEILRKCRCNFIHQITTIIDLVKKKRKHRLLFWNVYQSSQQSALGNEQIIIFG
jgi:hypothetical protein